MQSLGYALSQVQELETTVASYLVLVHELPPEAARDEAETLLEKTRRKTLGQLLHHLKAKTATAPDLSDALEAYLPKRNWLVHRSRGASRKLFYAPGGRETLAKNIAALGDETLAVSKQFATAIEVEAMKRGLTKEEMERRAAEIMRGWADA